MEKNNKLSEIISEELTPEKKKALLFDFKETFAFIWDIGKTLFFVVAIAFVIRFYLIQPFYVEGQSMEPSFNNGEYLLIDELSYHFRLPERGEVIVFRPPISTYQNYIKRIIAIPNEEIVFNNTEQAGFQIKNEKNPTGAALEEPYLSPGTVTRGDKNYKLDDNNYFVLGDNRGASSDSRVFGPVFKNNITGRVWFYIKLEPWKQINILGFHLSIPKIKQIGRTPKPIYQADQ